LDKRKRRVGKKAPAYGMRHSEETKKQMSESHRGKKWATDGKNQAQLEPGENPPDGWWFGRPKRK